LLQHLQDQAVAVVARLDAVNLVVQSSAEPFDIVEVVKTRRIRIGRHGEGVLGALEIGTDHHHGTVGEIGCAVGFLRGHPVAEEHIDVFVLHRRERHRH
jgi:hypothetical protein